MRKANVALDEVMDDHLAFARKSTLREYAESIGVAVAVALLLRAFVVEAFQIPSGLDDPDAGGGRSHLRLEVLLRAVAFPSPTPRSCSTASPSAAT